MVGVSSEALIIYSDGGKRGTKRRSAALLDLDILDCPVCCEALASPIFQCDNGHLVCASCCPKLSSKCPQCAFPIGHIRCRAMESVLESILVPCPNAKFGCTKNFSYGKELTHKKECIFSQCSCPDQDCNYTCSYNDLYHHYIHTHFSKIFKVNNNFKFDLSFNVRMNIEEKILIRKEYTKKLLFAVQCFKKRYGVYVTVSCIAPSAPEVGQFSYHLSYTVDGHTMTYGSPEVKKVLEVSFETPKNNFMLIPNDLLRGEWLNMVLCVMSS